MRGLLEKCARESGWTVALTCAGLAAAMGLFVQILPQFSEGLNEMMLQLPFIRMILSGMMNMDLESGLSPQLLLVVVWTHPIVLSVVFGLALVLCTRIPAAEIERGTIDVLLGWPLSRGTIYAAELITFLVSGALLLGSGFVGFVLSAETLAAELRPDVSNTLLTLVNLFAVYFVVGGIAQCISAASDRRGKALGLALALVLASFLLNFLANLWPPAQRLVFASFMHYYQPARVMLSGELSARDLGTLLASGAMLWGTGALVWQRRSVLTT